MTRLLSILVLAATPAVLAAGMQVPDRGDTRQVTGDSARSQSDRSTAHDRHTRKHRTTNHHHRHRTTVKSNTH